MLKLVKNTFDDGGNLTSIENIRNFRSYDAIGKWLQSKGQVGDYYVMPSNMTSLAAFRTIKVTKDKYGKQVEMEGAIY